MLEPQLVAQRISKVLIKGTCQLQAVKDERGDVRTAAAVHAGQLVMAAELYNVAPYAISARITDAYTLNPEPNDKLHPDWMNWTILIERVLANLLRRL